MPTQTDAATNRALEQALGKLRSGTRAAAMAAFTLAIGQTAMLRLRAVPEPTRTELLQSWVQAWAAGLLRVFGVEQHWASALPGRSGKARLVVANHRSPLDILLMLRAFGGSVLARHDLEGWPVLGWAARSAGTMFVDREDPKSGVRAIREIRRRLSAGQTVIVFPEGTTHAGDVVRPFLGGAFAAVRGLDADLLPVGVAYDPGAEFVDETFGEHIARVAQRRVTRVALCVGDPQAPASDRDAMAERMQQEIQRLVQRARAGLPLE